MFNAMEMNTVKLASDLSNATAILILLVMVIYRKSCLGISGRTQLLLAIVYACRNSDMWLDMDMPPNRTYSTIDTITRLFFFNATLITVYIVFVHFKETYQFDKDLRVTEPLMVPSFLVALYFSVPREVLWSFGLCLEGLAIVPQLFMIYRLKQIETVILYYLAVTGFNKVIVVANWASHSFDDRWNDEAIAGLIQISIYVIAIAIFFGRGIKFASGGKHTRFSDMLRSSKEDLTEKLDLENHEECPVKY